MAANRTNGALGRARLAHQHREIEHCVVVGTEFSLGRHLVGEFGDPFLSSRLRRIGLAGHATKPSGDIVVHNYGPAIGMERQPCGGCVVPDSGESAQLAQIARRNTVVFRNLPSAFPKQRSTPVQAKATRCCSHFHIRSRSEILSRREATRKLGKSGFGLSRPRALQERLSDQSQPRVPAGAP